MSIIVILIGLLVPALNKVRRYALGLQQNAQFHAIEAALEMFRSDSGEFPDSRGQDDAGNAYCGAMKLCEAMMGQDLMGFHPKSRFQANSILVGPAQLYRLPQAPLDVFQGNLQQREQPYLQADKVSAHKLSDIYPAGRLTAFNTGTPTAEMFVICDVFKKANNMGAGDESKLGMPVLYYKADPAGTNHDPNLYAPTITNNNTNIYNFYDNQRLLEAGVPWDQAQVHPLNNIGTFYRSIRNPQITTADRPYRPDTYVLISAGWDGLFGTRDDITNFQQK